MERLTAFDGEFWVHKDFPPVGEDTIDEFVDCVKELAARLASIEDILGDRYDLDRLRELVEADRDGRCGIPPVKLHQHIYRVFDGDILDEMVCKAMWEPFTPKPRWKVWVMGSGFPYYWDDCIGKTIFLTREAAETALKGEQNEKH